MAELTVTRIASVVGYKWWTESMRNVCDRDKMCMTFNISYREVIFHSKNLNCNCDKCVLYVTKVCKWFDIKLKTPFLCETSRSNLSHYVKRNKPKLKLVITSIKLVCYILHSAYFMEGTLSLLWSNKKMYNKILIFLILSIYVGISSWFKLRIFNVTNFSKKTYSKPIYFCPI